MQPILPYLQGRLKEAGPQAWPALVDALNAKLPADKHLTTHSLRKIAYGDRPNPGLAHVQALLDHFGLPAAAATAAEQHAAA